MKFLIIILFAILIFFACAIFGYQLAGQVNPVSQPTQSIAAEAGIQGEQYRFVIIRADALDAAQPRLISVWYLSVYFLPNNPTTLTLAQIYPVKTATPNAQALAQAFSTDPQTGEPARAFWDAMAAYHLQWDAFVLIDTEGANAFMEWLSGPTDYRPSLNASDGNAENSVQVSTQTCISVANAAAQEIGAFNWSAVVPMHFRSSLRMEHGLAYWDRIAHGGVPVRCEIVPAP